MKIRETVLPFAVTTALTVSVFCAGFYWSEWVRQQDTLKQRAEACERSNCEHADIINDLKLPIQGKATK